MDYLIVRHLFNFIGATTRWIFGMIWRTVFNKPKYTFDEYLVGPKKSMEYFDINGHRFNNILIGVLVFVIFLALII